MFKSSSLKRLTFDTIFFAYSILLILFLAAKVFAPVEYTTEEFAVSRMSVILELVIVALFLGAIKAALLKGRTVGSVLFGPPQARPFFRTLWGWHLTFAFALTLIVSLMVTEFSFRELTDPGGLRGAMRLFDGLFHANLDLLPIALSQIVQTIFIAFLATVLALPAAFLFSFLSAKNIMTGPVAFVVYGTLRTILNLCRSVEPLIWALIFTVWVGVGPFAGMLALMIHSAAALAKQCSEVVEDVNLGPVEAIRSTGAGPAQVIWFAMVPQVLMQFIAFTIYRWDTNVRMATVIGLVGGGGIGNLLIRYQGQAMWPEVGCIILVIAVAVWAMDVASAYIREALR